MVKAEYDLEDIPIGGEENAITRRELAKLWGCTDRMARRYIAELRAEDNGDDYIIMSKSSGKGYYRTNDPDEIEHFVRETTKRAKNTFRPLRKARRLLKEQEVRG